MSRFSFWLADNFAQRWWYMIQQIQRLKILVDIFVEKRRQHNTRETNLNLGTEAPPARLYKRLMQISCRTFLLFCYSLMTKKNSF